MDLSSMHLKVLASTILRQRWSPLTLSSLEETTDTTNGAHLPVRWNLLQNAMPITEIFSFVSFNFSFAFHFVPFCLFVVESTKISQCCVTAVSEIALLGSRSKSMEILRLAMIVMAVSITNQATTVDIHKSRSRISRDVSLRTNSLAMHKLFSRHVIPCAALAQAKLERRIAWLTSVRGQPK